MIGQLSVDNLTESQFDEISRLVKSLCGINLHSGKRELVRARLTRRLRDLHLPGFDDYLDYLRANEAEEIVALLDVLSTNLTRFFREPVHFDILAEHVAGLARRDCRASVSIWSAGCSSGEEPYSMAIRLLETQDAADCDIRILATDLSTRVLATAREAVYPKARLAEMEHGLIARHFSPVDIDDEPHYRVAESVRRLVHFARLNLIESWPMQGPFSIIMCRNVMIYFDKSTQQSLVRRFWQILEPGGILFIGHSESLTGVDHKFRYVQPTVYEKPLHESGMRL
jgi:chemotaxis protein methyltransferase CheR